MRFNPYVILAVVLAIVGTGAAGYMHGVRHERGRAAAEEVKLIAVEERAAQAAAREIAKIKIIHRTNTQVLEREIVNNPLPDHCRLSDDGLRALNAILEGRPVATGDRELSGADAAP